MSGTDNQKPLTNLPEYTDEEMDDYMDEHYPYSIDEDPERVRPHVYTSKLYKELINDLSEASGYYQKEVKDILDCLAYCVAIRMTKGKKSKIDNFGIFDLRVYPPRLFKMNSKNMKGTIMTDTIVSCKFKAAPTFREAMKGFQKEKEIQEALETEGGVI